LIDFNHQQINFAQLYISMYMIVSHHYVNNKS